MARRRTKKGFSLDKNLLQNAIIATLLFQLSPRLLNQFIFKDQPLSGIALTGASVGVGVLAGQVMKKPEITSLAIALGASDVLSELVSGSIDMFGTTKTGTADFLSIDSNGQINRLKDYTNNPTVMPAVQYQTAYELMN